MADASVRGRLARLKSRGPRADLPSPAGRGPSRVDQARPGDPCPIPCLIQPSCPRTSTADERVLILDFGTQVTQLIARRLRESGVYCEIWPFNADPARIRAFTPRAYHPVRRPGQRARRRTSPRAPQMVFEQGVPVLGICYGQR